MDEHDRRESESEPAWDERRLSDPHAVGDKAGRVQRMFGAIAGSYDLNNRVHSLGSDQLWRRKAVRLCQVRSSDVVLDVACGTGDLALAFADAGVQRVIGLDFVHEMLTRAEAKRRRWAGRRGAKPTPPVHWAGADAMKLPAADRSVDVVSIAFGIRNVADPAAAIAEFRRVLKPGGRVCILEFSTPGNPVLRALYRFYFHRLMPRTATLLSGDRTGAYKYLPRSVDTFLDREALSSMLREAGFASVELTPLTFGIAVAYVARLK